MGLKWVFFYKYNLNCWWVPSSVCCQFKEDIWIRGILYRSEGKQPNWKLGILFRGKGRVTMYEKLGRHKNVNFFFEINAWIDIDLCRKWIDITPSTFVKDETLETFLLLDHFFCQYSDKFKENLSAIKGLCWYDLKEGTDHWQTVDAGYAYVLKKLVGIQQMELLDKDGMQITIMMAGVLVLKNVGSSSHIGLERHGISYANLSMIIQAWNVKHLLVAY